MSKKLRKIKINDKKSFFLDYFYNDKKTFCGVSVACPTTEIPQKVLVLAVLLGSDTF
jgi:hypothetical protein